LKTKFNPIYMLVHFGRGAGVGLWTWWWWYIVIKCLKGVYDYV